MFSLSSAALLLNDGAKKVQTSAEPSLLELCRVPPFLLRSAKIRLFSDITKFRVAIRTDFQQPLIRNLVNKANSYFCGGRTIVFFDAKHSLSQKKISLSCYFPDSCNPRNFFRNLTVLTVLTVQNGPPMKSAVEN